MSILIKNMEMPKNCFLCPLSFLQGERLFCVQTKEEVLRAKIDSNCPLIELPPHGDLIDRAELNDKIYHTSFCDPVVDWDDICHAPVIIESERE